MSKKEKIYIYYITMAFILKGINRRSVSGERINVCCLGLDQAGTSTCILSPNHQGVTPLVV